MDCSTPVFPVHHQFPELTQTHVHWVGMPSNHLILCCPLHLPPSILPSISVFSSESVLHIRWPRSWSFSFSISPSNEYSRLISFRVDWLDLLAVQGTVHQFLLLSLSCILSRLDLESILLPPASVLLSGTLTCILVIPVYLIPWGWVKTQLCQEDFQVILLPCSLYYTDLKW